MFPFLPPNVPGHQPVCEDLTPMNRHTLNDTEKAEYITAEKCLMNSPPKAGITGAQNRWDELHWAHVHTSNIIHGVGACK